VSGLKSQSNRKETFYCKCILSD